MGQQKQQTTKKRKKRRSYLADFRLDASGNYKYTGNVYAFEGEEKDRVSYVRKVGALAILTELLAACQEFLPGTRMNNTFYVLIPWLLQFLAASSVVWAFARLAWAGSRVREYVWEKSDRKLPVRSLLTLIFSAATVVAEVIFICINGLGEPKAPAVLRPVLSLINTAASLSLHLLVRGESRYRKI